MTALSSADPAPILCIGETMILVTPDRAVPLEHAEQFALSMGGAESTVALYLTELGYPAAWLSRVGDDPLGRRMLSALSGFGVDISLVEVASDAPTGVYFKDPGGGETSVYYYRTGSAASRMTPRIVDGIDWAATPLVHVSGITAGLSDSCRDMLTHVFDLARDYDTPASFDVNFRPGLWSAAEAAPVLRDLAGRADIVFVGRDEAETLWGIGDPVLLQAFLGTTGRLVVKDGAVGATEIGDDGTTFVAAHTVEVVEVVGAGDAFAAGYLAGTLRGDSAESRLALGHDLAARALASIHDFAPA